MPQQETSAPPPRKVTGSSQRSPLHTAGSRRYLDFGKCACKRHVEAATASGVDLVRRSTPGPEMPSVRRLTAILAADVAGYSRLMGVDEEGTHERLKAHFGELVHPKIAVTRAWLVIPSADRAIRVGPRDPSIGFRYLMMGYGVTGTHAAACRECYSNDAHEPMGRNHSPVRDGTLS
jgi:hypothetical protein